MLELNLFSSNMTSSYVLDKFLFKIKEINILIKKNLGTDNFIITINR